MGMRHIVALLFHLQNDENSNWLQRTSFWLFLAKTFMKSFL